jgi:hypothetical protein
MASISLSPATVSRLMATSSGLYSRAKPSLVSSIASASANEAAPRSYEAKYSRPSATRSALEGERSTTPIGGGTTSIGRGGQKSVSITLRARRR